LQDEREDEEDDDEEEEKKVDQVEVPRWISINNLSRILASSNKPNEEQSPEHGEERAEESKNESVNPL
jgi:hypothetical protein